MPRTAKPQISFADWELLQQAFCWSQQVLRSLILKRVKNWDFCELRERIADGYTLRQFTDFY